MSGDAPDSSGSPPTSRAAARAANRAARQTTTVAWLSLILRLSVGVILIYAALPKLAHPDQFADIITNYSILPAALVPWLALTLPWLELTTGIFLILGVATRAAAILTTTMFVVFTAALVTAEVRHLDIACGCFNVAANSGKTGESLWASALMVVAGIALVALADDGERFSLIRPGRWSSARRRSAVIAVLVAVAVVLTDAVVIAAAGPDDRTTATKASSGTRTLTFLARRELASDELLAPLAKTQPDLKLKVTQVIAASDVPGELRAGVTPDVVEVEVDQLPSLVARGYLQPIDTSRLEAWNQLSDAFRSFPGLTMNGNTYAAPVDAGLTGIVYREDKFPSAPSSYRVLFEHRFKNEAGIENDATTAVRLGASVYGWGDEPVPSSEQLATVFGFLGTDRPHFYTYYQDQAELEQLFSYGRLLVSTGTAATAERAAASGVPLRFAAPTEGLLVRSRALAIGATCTDLDAAYALLSYYLSLPVQQHAAARFGTVPSRDDVAATGFLDAPRGVPAGTSLILVTPPTDQAQWRRLWRGVAVKPGAG